MVKPSTSQQPQLSYNESGEHRKSRCKSKEAGDLFRHAGFVTLAHESIRSDLQRVIGVITLRLSRVGLSYCDVPPIFQYRQALPEIVAGSKQDKTNAYRICCMSSMPSQTLPLPCCFPGHFLRSAQRGITPTHSHLRIVHNLRVLNLPCIQQRLLSLSRHKHTLSCRICLRSPKRS